MIVRQRLTRGNSGRGPNRDRNKHERAERLMLRALDVLLENGALDITFINQRDLDARGILRDGNINACAVADFVKDLEREFGGAA